MRGMHSKATSTQETKLEVKRLKTKCSEEKIELNQRARNEGKGIPPRGSQEDDQANSGLFQFGTVVSVL